MNTNLPNVGQRNRKRHPANPALKLFWECRYQNMPVLTHEGPLIENYLEILLRIINQASQDCPRLFAARIDLHFPAQGYTGYTGNDNTCIGSFINRFQWELDIAGIKFPHKMRYVWCREQVTSVHHHYHLLLLLNKDAYRTLGKYKATSDDYPEHDNLYQRIVRAWSHAINWPEQGTRGLVHATPYKWIIYRGDQAAFAEVFYGASYMCKAYSKPIGQGMHCFEGSRR
ncbi:hypothetical protein HSBAA_18370 [Vreelandella sulfidaeris]|uniref:YagK/YfjJ C-terminal domain-containing protein n=1 Tax=Vreelandella sulfidaeris TaxID=115553 RepID=A0A455U7R7_9GAMM|nr:hypothetical protein HSBAA_18370 [Halomonas sulfidaeris]